MAAVRGRRVRVIFGGIDCRPFCWTPKGTMPWAVGAVCAEVERVARRATVLRPFRRWHITNYLNYRVTGVELIVRGVAWRVVLNQGIFK